MSATSQRNFNGTTLSLGSAAQGQIISMQIEQGGAVIDVYQPGDVVRLMELGIPTAKISVGLRGIAGTNAPVLGAVGAPTITLGNTATLTIPGANWQTMSVSYSGKEDGAWEGSASYSPCPTGDVAGA